MAIKLEDELKEKMSDHQNELYDLESLMQYHDGTHGDYSLITYTFALKGCLLFVDKAILDFARSQSDKHGVTSYGNVAIWLYKSIDSEYDKWRKSILGIDLENYSD